MSHLKLQRGARGGWKLVIRGMVATTSCNRTDCPVKSYCKHNKQTNKPTNKQSTWGQIIKGLDPTTDNRPTEKGLETRNFFFAISHSGARYGHVI